MPVISVFRRLRHEDCYEFEASFDYIVKLCVKKQKQNKIKLAQGYTDPTRR